MTQIGVAGLRDREDAELVARIGRSPTGADFCSQEGAQALKAKIEGYWRERGHEVSVMLQNVGFHPAIRAARFDLRSDMINGMPRSAAPGASAEAGEEEAS